MLEEKIIKFLTSEVEPIFHYWSGEKYYRAAVRFRDGFYLPCVVFKSANRRLNSEVKLLSLYKDGHHNYDYHRKILSLFTQENLIYNAYIETIEHSPFAIPKQHKETLHEAADALKINLTLDYIHFVAQMSDKRLFSFGFQYDTEFLDIPDGYQASQIERIFPNRTIADKKYKNRNYFTCYLESLE